MNARRRRARDFTLIVWFVAAIIVAVAHRWVPEATWLMIHLVTLGALTHSILVWSEHFSRSLLKTRTTQASERAQRIRLGLLTAGSAMVLGGVPSSLWLLTLTGATIVSAAVLWHGLALWSDLRRALPGRFHITVRYYVTAAACLPVGATFGVLLARGLPEQWHARLLVAHTMVMLLGWVGLTVIGTLVTFWPTVLRTRMDERAELTTKRLWRPLVASIGVVLVGALWGVNAVAVIGLVVYVALVCWWGRTLLTPLRKKPLEEFAPASIGAAMVWFLISMGLTGWTVLTSDDGSLARAFPGLAAYWVGGFILQLLLGALSYLLPSMFGGGPRIVRAGGRWFNRWAGVRLTVVNAGLMVWMMQPPSWVRVTVSLAVLLAYTAFLPLLIGGVRACIIERRRREAGEPAKEPENTPAFSGSGVVAGLAIVALVASLGFAITPDGRGEEVAAASDVTPTGRTLEVTVEARDMRFEPSQIEAEVGDQVVITVINTDEAMVHDLYIAGQQTPRLESGDSAVLDLGVVGESTEGWCTIVGHRQQGMTLDLVVAGSEAPGGQSENAHEGHGDHGASAPGDRMTFDPDAPLSASIDANAPKPTDEVDHRFTIESVNENLEVAPGVWQTRWVFRGGPEGIPNPGGSVGPTIRGRVGDTFEVTFVNNGDMGHSIDFHASNVAPDRPMRTIAPGESLVYRFTAHRAGAWLYHCGTMPMTAHIAGAMHGAVIIDPEDLAPADKEYILVQSEIYMEPGTGDSPESATPVDAARAAADTPDFVTFNGIADQYLQKPLPAKVGERVRFWVVAAGPNRGSAFHIVGAQFDTTYHEGAYQLKQGRDAFGSRDGGSQVLDVAVASGGFVETVFPEPGHYTMVDHAMANAERGARGIVEVTP